MEAAIRPVNVHYPTTSLISLENTHNRGGGSCYNLQELEAIAEVAQRHRIPLHLDGARIFNALVATGQQAADYGRIFDTISVCLSKGLGAPVGSVLLGSKAFIQKTKRIRKVLGGGMRQAGYLAAAGLYALEHNVARLADDHRRAQQVGATLALQAYVAEVLAVETNLVIFRLTPEMPAEQFLARLEEQGIKAASFGPQMIRFVTHLDINDEMITRLEKVLKSL